MAGMNAELRDENSEGNYSLTVYITVTSSHAQVDSDSRAPGEPLVQISIVSTRSERTRSRIQQGARRAGVGRLAVRLAAAAHRHSTLRRP